VSVGTRHPALMRQANTERGASMTDGQMKAALEVIAGL